MEDSINKNSHDFCQNEEKIIIPRVLWEGRGGRLALTFVTSLCISIVNSSGAEGEVIVVETGCNTADTGASETSLLFI